MSQPNSNQQADDLTRIQGIGNSVESRLNKAGILTYEQLAAQSPETLAGILKEMIGATAARIDKQNWIGQARKFAEETVREEGDLLDETAADRQHYEVFTLELLLGEDQNVRRTRVVHVQDTKQESWAGWDEARLVAFLAEKAGFTPPAKEARPAVEAVPIEVTVVASEQPEEPPAEPAVPPKLDLTRVEVVSIDTRAPVQAVHREQPFGVLLTLDLSDLPKEQQANLSYKAQIYARQLGSKQHNLIASTEGIPSPEDATHIRLVGGGLMEGVYSISVSMKVNVPTANASRPYTLPFSQQAGLLQVV